MKKNRILTLVLCLVLAVLMAGCAGGTSNGESGTAAGEENAAQIANPVVEYDTLAAAEKAAQFSFTVPEGVVFEEQDYGQYYYSVISGDLLEVRYGTSGDEVCYMRKAAAAKDTDDISGDYNVYDDVMTEDLVLEDGSSYPVTLKGKDGKYYLALWQRKGTTDNGIWNYAIGIRGVSADELLELAKMVE